MDLTSVATAAALSLILLTSTPTYIQAATPAAPAPSPPGPVNITAILAKGGQYATFIRFLTQTTQVADQINNQLNNSNQGMTVFAPTDNAFSNLPAGTLNNLTPNQQVQLVQYHVMPRYYSLTDLLSVSNPVPTQAAGPDGRVYGLNFTGQGSQLNISTGVVDTQLNNALSQENVEGLLAVYSVDKVLLPKEFYEAPAPAAADVAAAPPKAAKSKPSEAAADQAEPRSSGSVMGGQKSTSVLAAAAAGIGLLCLGGLLS